MYLKIRQSYREPKGDRSQFHNEVPEKMIECDRYDKRPYDPIDSEAESAESFYCDANGKVDPTITIITYKNRKFADMFLVGHATIFVMNNEGKTIEIIYT